MQSFKFTKMHGAGNDYIYVNCMERQLDDISAVARAVSDRHYGIGSDGLVLILPVTNADAFIYCLRNLLRSVFIGTEGSKPHTGDLFSRKQGPFRDRADINSCFHCSLSFSPEIPLLLCRSFRKPSGRKPFRLLPAGIHA